MQISLYISLPSLSLSYPSRSSQSARLGSLCYLATSHYFTRDSICTSKLLSQFVPHLCVYKCILYSVHQYHFSRFHIYVLICGTCFSLSDLLHFVKEPLGSSTSLQLTQIHSFLWPNNIPLYKFITISLSIHLLMDI